MLNGLYRYIEELLSSRAGNSVKIQNWSRVAQLLEKANYKNAHAQPQNIDSPLTTSWQHDSGEAIDVSAFCGRIQKVRSLERWIVDDQARLIALLSRGGIGKTALSVKAEHVQNKFDVIWRSLRHAPPVTEILAQLLQFFAPNTNIPNNIHSSSQRIHDLCDRRCLLVLNSCEILATYITIVCLSGYEGPN